MERRDTSPMTMTHRIAATLSMFLAAFAASPLNAQVIRGRVTEMASATPVAGAVVSLLGETGEGALVSVLTTVAGEYAVRAPAPGRYRLGVKRIGVRRFVSAEFELTAGETRVLDVPIDAVALTLPEVTVSGLCVTRPRELARIASLWDEARTALQATEISVRDSLIEAQISRYASDLDPPTLRVLFDWRSDAQMLVDQPFTSLSGDSLSAVGYWRALPGDSIEYLAPDASALASNAFIRDHCFMLVGAPRGRPDLVGLSFRPARDRQLPDIAGTIWLDARRFELRFIEFRYTQVPLVPNADRIGGEVHYARLASGAWIVDRWFIRMPQLVASQDQLAPRHQFREEGGAVITEGVVSAIRLASVTGIFRDSAGRPAPGAVVRAVGTHRQVLTGADGRFRLDSLPPGDISIVAHTDGYDSFGLLAASRRLALQGGRVERIEFRAPNSAGLRREVCPDPRVPYVPPPGGRGALRLLMVDSATVSPLPGVEFLVSWPLIAEVAYADSTQERFRHAMTDSRGAATFCNLPPGIPLEVSLLGAGGRRMHVMMAQVSRTGITGRVVTGRINR